MARRQPGPRAPGLRRDLPDLIDEGVAWQRRIAVAGYAGIDWPREVGGRGLTREHNSAWMLECALAGVPPVLNMVGLVLTAGSLLAFGTDEQKAEHLEATLHADRVWCQLFSEPGAGSDLGGLATRAEADGDRFVVNGQKVWCSGGRYSDWGILMARTDPAAPKHQGISFFLCPMDLPGIEVWPLRQMTGEAEFDEVFFTDVSLPASNLIGPLHGGWGVGMAVLTNERGHIGTSVIGLERRLEAMASLSEGRDLDAVARHTGDPGHAGHDAQGDGAAAGPDRVDRGIAHEAGDHRDDVRRGHAPRRHRRGRRHARRPGRRRHARGARRAHRGRYQPGAARNIIGERLLGLPREPKPAA